MASHLAPNLQVVVTPGGAPGALFVPDIKVGDVLVAVLNYDQAAFAGMTSLVDEFTITDTEEITNDVATGTDTTGTEMLVMFWVSDPRGGGLHRS